METGNEPSSLSFLCMYVCMNGWMDSWIEGWKENLKAKDTHETKKKKKRVGRCKWSKYEKREVMVWRGNTVMGSKREIAV